jgi:hypothetical protein
MVGRRQSCVQALCWILAWGFHLVDGERWVMVAGWTGLVCSSDMGCYSWQPHLVVIMASPGQRRNPPLSLTGNKRSQVFQGRPQTPNKLGDHSPQLTAHSDLEVVSSAHKRAAKLQLPLLMTDPGCGRGLFSVGVKLVPACFLRACICWEGAF